MKKQSTKLSICIVNYSNDYKEINQKLKQIADKEEDNITGDLERLLGKASRLPDGTAVFMSKNFTLYKEDGKEVPGDKIASVEWVDNGPTYEEFLVAKAKADPNWEKKKERRRKKKAPPTYEEFLEVKMEQEKLEERQRELQKLHQDVIGYMRRRLHDVNNPPSKEELEQFKEILNSAPAKP